MKKGRLYALLIFVVIVTAGAIYTVNFLYEKEQEEEAFYNTQTPSMGDIVLKTVASGSIQPRDEILIKPQVSGTVSSVSVEAGDVVKAGDILAEVRIIPNMAAESSADNRVQRAKITLRDAQQTFDRNSNLFDKGVVSAKDMQQFTLSLNQANEELLAAKDNLRIVKEGLSSRGAQTSNTIILSTIDGMVLDVPVKEGNRVIEANNFNDGTTVAIIADMQNLIFIGKIDESEVEKLHEDMTIKLKIAAIDGATYEASLENIAPKGVEELGAIQFEIKAAVHLSDGQFLRSGYSATAEVELDRRDNVITLSEILVQYSQHQPYVDVLVAPNIYERRDISLGLSDGLVVEVLSGVSVTDEIKVWNQPFYGEKPSDSSGKGKEGGKRKGKGKAKSK